MTTELIWQHLEAPGWEHVRIMDDHPGWTVFDSILVREHQDQVLRGGYTLVIDKQWRTLELRLMLESSPGTMEGIHLLTEGDGRWTDANEQPIPELDGCLDVDIEWTPLTKSLPINRLQMERGEEHTIRIAKISLPAMTFQPITQKYSRSEDTRLVRFLESDLPCRTIAIDQAGFVTEYPEKYLRTGYV